MRYIYLLLALLMAGCREKTTEPVNATEVIAADSLAVKPAPKTIRDYEVCDNYIHWTADHTDTTSYMCEITFHGDYALIWYHGQCIYKYFTSSSSKVIELWWMYQPDCLLDMGFLEKSNGVHSYPKHGDSFSKYTLVNDTVIKVRYSFPDWVKKVNTIAGDSIFPTYLYLKRYEDS